MSQDGRTAVGVSASSSSCAFGKCYSVINALQFGSVGTCSGSCA